MSVVTIPQVYYWSVNFEDGTYLSQFDEFGNEVLIRNIIGKDNLKYNPITKQDEVIQHSNYFSEYEKVHGRVTQIALIPFTSEFAGKCIQKQPGLTCLITTAKVIIKSVPVDSYATFSRQNLIHYATEKGHEPWGELSTITLMLVNRETRVADKFEINLKARAS